MDVPSFLFEKKSSTLKWLLICKKELIYKLINLIFHPKFFLKIINQLP